VLTALALVLLLSACRTYDYRPAQLACLDTLTTAAAPGSPAGPRFTGDILVSYRLDDLSTAARTDSDLRQQQALGVSRTHGLNVVQHGNDALPDLLRGAGMPSGELLEALRADPRVDWAFPDFTVHTLEAVDCATDQWNIADFGVPAAWGRGPGQHEVVVAVIDSGIDVDHPELKDAMLPGYNFEQMTDDPRPGEPLIDRHGTHVAGIIAARGERITGVAGFPETIRVLPIRIFDDRGDSANFSDLLRALHWAVGGDVSGAPPNPYPARVINLSLGSQLPPFSELNKAVTEAVGTGAVIIAASGNTGETVTDPSSGIFTPANTDAALAIGSVDSDFTRSPFSMFGGPKPLTVLAPGGRGPASCGTVLSTLPEAGYGCQGGTSMAAPFVSASVALLLSHEPELRPHQIEARLRAATHWDPSYMSAVQYGSGVLCTDRLLSGSNPEPADRC